MHEPRPVLLSEGSLFHRTYEVRRCLKVGGMAVVYEVVHRVTRRSAALKVMLPEILLEAAMRDRFALEARITAGVESDHIVDVLDAGIDEDTGTPFIVMELLRGDDLESLVRQRGPLGREEVVKLLSQAALALDAVHRVGIVHRDLKPSNLFLADAEHRPPRLKVLDFGIAKVLADGAQPTTRNLGTPVYMSPEQVRGDGDIGPAADLYTLGHVAYTLLVGAPYWDDDRAGNSRGLFDKIEQGAAEPATLRAQKRGMVLPEAFDPWFAHATSVEPEERFASAGALVAALAEALGVARAGAVSAPAMAPVKAAARPAARRRRWSAGATVGALLLVGVLGGATWAGARWAGEAKPRGTALAGEPAPAIPAPTSIASAVVAAAPIPATAGERQPSPPARRRLSTAPSPARAQPAPAATAAATSPPPEPPAKAVVEPSSPAPSANPFGTGVF